MPSVHKDYTYKLTCPHCGEVSDLEVDATLHREISGMHAARDGGLKVTALECDFCEKDLLFISALSVYGVVALAFGDPNKPHSDAQLCFPEGYTPTEMNL